MNIKTTPSRIPKVMIPNMIHNTTKCPEQHANPSSFCIPWKSLAEWGRVDLLLMSLIGSWLGAPFSVNTIFGFPRIIIDLWNKSVHVETLSIEIGTDGLFWRTYPWKDLWSKWGVPGMDGTWYIPELDISAIDLARRTVVAPLIIEGGTEAGPVIMWGPRPYKAARGIAGWWWTGQGSPSHVWDKGGIEAVEAAANIGTLWTERMEPLGAIKNCGGATGPISWGWIG